MSASVWGALVTAGVLGVTHAVEPDHVAGISSVTSQYGDSRLSALVGACFSLGHVALVVAWLAAASVVLGRTEFPPVFDRVGTLGVGVVLGALGAAMAVNGLRAVRHAHAHEHGGEVHEHAHVHLPLLGPDHRHASDDGPTDGAVPHGHGHGARAYLKTGVVGALFTLSPPVSMIAFASALFGTHGGGAVALAVATYAVSITATMSAVGAGVGTVVGAASLGPRVHAGARVLAGVLVVGLAATLLAEALPVTLSL